MMPSSRVGSITESGKNAAKAPSVRFLGEQDGCGVFEVGSGDYRFRSTLKK